MHPWPSRGLTIVGRKRSFFGSLATSKHSTVLPPLSLTSLYPPMQCSPPDPPPESRSCRGARCSRSRLTLGLGSSRWKAWPRPRPEAPQNLAGEPSPAHSVAAPGDRASCKRSRRRKVCVEHRQKDSSLLTLGREVAHCRSRSWRQRCLLGSTSRRRNPGRWSSVLGRRACNPPWRRCCRSSRPSPQTRAGWWWSGSPRCGRTPSPAQPRSCTGPG